ncbi:MAG: penicillin acylase family protein, partial [Myxococcota bacterium]|nr:penicillin acylase family protein [Myxococcota bacterium]
ARTARTRMNARYLTDTVERGDDGLLSLEEVEASMLSSRSLVAEELLDGVVERCEETSSVEVSGEMVDLTEACAVLAAWDGTYSTEAVGATVWREMLASGEFETGDLTDAGLLFEVAFDPDDPVDTPNTLTEAPTDQDDPILVALAIAIQNLTDAGFTVDQSLGELQFRRKGETDHPVLGAQFREGGISIAEPGDSGNSTLLPRREYGEVINSATTLTTDGYPVEYGNSYMLVMEFTDDGPRARAAMAYSQSQDPDSPHFDDQTALFSESTLRDVVFTEADIAADPELVIETLTLD